MRTDRYRGRFLFIILIGNAGTFTEWSPNIAMTLINDIWVVEGVTISAGNHEMKFANTSDWSGDDWGNATGLSGTAQLTTGGAPNITFTLTTAGSYDIYFNDISLAYSIMSDTTTIPGTKVIPKHSRLYQNYPNPFIGETKIVFTLPSTLPTLLEIYNSQGQKIKTLVKGTISKGQHEVMLDAADLNSGVYIYKLRAGRHSDSKKLILTK